MKKLLALAVLALALVGCTDAERASYGAYGEESEIACFSGNATPVFTDTSTGKILAAEGIIYKSKTTGKYVRAYADCIAITK